MELVNNILIWVATVLGGLTLAGIISAIVCGILKGAFNRAIQKMNVEKVAESVVDKSMSRIKEVSFSQNVQPVLESGLEKVNEKSEKFIEKSLKDTQEKYDKIVNVLEKFYAYFEDSLVSESKKQELKNAIELAKVEVSPITEIPVQEIVIDPPKKSNAKENAIQKEITNKTRIER